MNLRAMDAVFPVREKSVNHIKILSESSPKDADELRYIDAVWAKRELRSESTPKEEDEFRDIDAVLAKQELDSD